LGRMATGPAPRALSVLPSCAILTTAAGGRRRRTGALDRALENAALPDLTEIAGAVRVAMGLKRTAVLGGE